MKSTACFIYRYVSIFANSAEASLDHREKIMVRVELSWFYLAIINIQL